MLTKIIKPRLFERKNKLKKTFNAKSISFKQGKDQQGNKIEIKKEDGNTETFTILEFLEELNKRYKFYLELSKKTDLNKKLKELLYEGQWGSDEYADILKSNPEWLIKQIGKETNLTGLRPHPLIYKEVGEAFAYKAYSDKANDCNKLNNRLTVILTKPENNEFSKALLAIVEKVAGDDEQAQAMHALYDLFNEYHKNFGTRCIEFLNADHLLKITQKLKSSPKNLADVLQYISKFTTDKVKREYLDKLIELKMSAELKTALKIFCPTIPMDDIDITFEDNEVVFKINNDMLWTVNQNQDSYFGNLNSVDLISESLKVIFNHQLKELVFQDNNEAAIKNKLSKQYGKTIETIRLITKTRKMFD